MTLPRALAAFLSEAPDWLERSLLALGAAVSLTDDLASALVADCVPPNVDAVSVIRLLRSCDFVVARNSEWHFDPGIRRWQVERLSEQRTFAASRHAIVRYFSDSHTDRSAAGDTVPSYLFTLAGRAYHQVYNDNENGVRLYAQAARGQFSGFQWLAGVLAEEQQELGLLPKNAIEPAFLRGMALYQEGNPTGAEQHLTRVIQSGDERIEVAIAFHILGVISARRRKFQAALEFLDRGVSLHGRLQQFHGLWMVLNTRGSVKRDIRDIEAALVDLDRAVFLAEDSGDLRSVAMVLNSRGGVKRDRGDLDGALVDLNRAAVLAEKSGDRRNLAFILHSRGGVKRDLGDLEGAAADLDHAVLLAEKTGDRRSLAMILNTRGGLRRDRGDVEDALADVGRAIDIGSRQGDSRTLFMVLNSRAAIRRDAGDIAGAISDWEQVIGVDPDTLKEWGFYASTVTNNLKAVRKLRNRVTAAPDPAHRSHVLNRFYFELAKGYLVNAKDPVRPIWLLERVLQLDAQGELRPSALFSLGKSYFRLHQYERAAEFFMAASEAGFQGSEVAASLGFSLTQLGKKLSETKEYYQAALEDSDNAWARSWYALALAAEGHHEQAETMGWSAVTLPGHEKNSALLCNLARVLLATGNQAKREAAIDVLRLAEVHAPSAFDWPRRMLDEIESHRI